MTLSECRKLIPHIVVTYSRKSLFSTTLLVRFSTELASHGEIHRSCPPPSISSLPQTGISNTGLSHVNFCYKQYTLIDRCYSTCSHPLIIGAASESSNVLMHRSIWKWENAIPLQCKQHIKVTLNTIQGTTFGWSIGTSWVRKFKITQNVTQSAHGTLPDLVGRDLSQVSQPNLQNSSSDNISITSLSWFSELIS